MQLSPEEIKKNVGIYAAGFISQNMIVGLGTGTTVLWLIRELGKRVKDGLSIHAIPTSQQTAQLCKEENIPLLTLEDVDQLELTIDGADEIDPNGNLTKGGGGALLQEKIVAAASARLIIIADHKKLVNELGRFPLPLEVIPFGYSQVRRKVLAMGCRSAELRYKEGKPFISDHGHYILDCGFDTIPVPEMLNDELHRIPGVVETGLFCKMASEAVIGYPDDRIEVSTF